MQLWLDKTILAHFILDSMPEANGNESIDQIVTYARTSSRSGYPALHVQLEPHWILSVWFWNCEVQRRLAVPKLRSRSQRAQCPKDVICALGSHGSNKNSHPEGAEPSSPIPALDDSKDSFVEAVHTRPAQDKSVNQKLTLQVAPQKVRVDHRGGLEVCTVFLVRYLGKRGKSTLGFS